MRVFIARKLLSGTRPNRLVGVVWDLHSAPGGIFTAVPMRTKPFCYLGGRDNPLKLAEGVSLLVVKMIVAMMTMIVLAEFPRDDRW